MTGLFGSYRHGVAWNGCTGLAPMRSRGHVRRADGLGAAGRCTPPAMLTCARTLRCSSFTVAINAARMHRGSRECLLMPQLSTAMGPGVRLSKHQPISARCPTAQI
ncbi:hypothetical protein GQ55_1G270700 [Panicum hallii var. hallii]|uniref:Uncharacterized protein n=1 Tax=Panicum hallii var. hallii TaxID=1504633 RepID=A0A2T7F7Z5_9POAL|nr:hypothetical protein GQ55_1G270700 [Panicum hallii var. hallii]